MSKPNCPEPDLGVHKRGNQNGQCDRTNDELSIVYDALNSSASGVIITNLEGEIRYVNSAFLRILGYESKAGVLGKNAAELFATDEGRRFSHVREIVDQRRSETEEFEVRRKDGTTLPVEVSSASVTDHTHQIAGMTASFIDITERKRTERQLRKTHRELEAFVHVVSHELKTPIAAIGGFSEMLLARCLDKLDEKGRLCAERIFANAQRMEALVNDLLALSRVGEIVLTLKGASSSKIIKAVITNLRERLGAKGIEVVIPKNLPVILCDEKWITHVFENLLVNAMKFMEANQKPRIEIGYVDHGEAHCFFVNDNGIGIEPEEQGRIFEMFYRAKKTEAQDGTGLGLAIVDKIIRSHGGKVWVESDKQKGSTFYFTLPKAPKTD
jgi:PAS domain S-box-containing protein